jgi:tRNA(fMet)-specific endonuclease VapC
MGLIIDSSEFIKAERTGKTARQTVLDIRESVGPQDVAMSIITLVELQHGVARANSPHRKALRAQFIEELMGGLIICPVTIPIALRAGQINGENAGRGLHLSLSDLLIGVTALELGYGVLTSNVRHFQMIPNLKVVAG